MSYQERSGDLFAQSVGAIGQGCNTRGVMGKGIAAEFARRHPEMKAAYQRQCASGAFTLGKVWVWKQATPWIYNLATQERPGAHARLDAIEESVSKALAHARANGIFELALPRIGAGIGGLNWNDVRAVLQSVSETSPTSLIVIVRPEDQ